MNGPMNIKLLNILHTTYSLMLCRDSWLILTQGDTHVFMIRLFFSLHFIRSHFNAREFWRTKNAT